MCVHVSVSSRYQLYECLQSTTVYRVSELKQLKSTTSYDSFVPYIAESKAEKESYLGSAEGQVGGRLTQ